MGQFDAGKTILWLAVYFIILILGLFIVETVASEYNLAYSVTSNANESSLLAFNSQFGVCEEPRIVIDSDTKEESQISLFNQNSDACQDTIGNYNENQCSSISGCTWVNVTPFWWWQNTDVQECSGTVNLTSLGLAGVELNVYGEVDIQAEINDILDTPTRQIACETLGYTWSDEQTEQEVSIGTITSITGSLFSYQASFTDNFLLDLLLTTLLFYLPFLIFLVAIYFSLPFIH